MTLDAMDDDNAPRSRSLGDLTDPVAVEEAVAEFDELGRDAFLTRYGYGPARSYFLEVNGRRYDSKAIVGVAVGKQFPDTGPLDAHQFNGGEATVRAKLTELGFHVAKVGGDDAATGTLNLDRVWWVNQGQTYAQERDGGYVWAPELTKAGRPASHHTSVSLLRVGDVVVHYSQGALRAVSQVIAEPAMRERPNELPAEMWGSSGHYCALRYWDISVPIRLDEVPNRQPADGPFNSSGGVNQGYLYKASADLAGRLLREFPRRWPEGSPFDVDRQQASTPWDEFVFWAAKLFDGARFDEAERDFKVDIGAQLASTAEAVAEHADDWLLLLRRCFASGLTDYRAHSRFLDWVRDQADQAIALISPIWDHTIGIDDAIQQFLDEWPPEVVAGPGERAAIASFLSMGRDVTQFTIYRPTPFQKAYELTGDPGPPTTSAIDRVRHAWGFLDRFVEEAHTRGLELRDRLDAQGLVWAITKSAPPRQWSAADKQAFRQYTGVDVSDFQHLSDRLFLPVEFFEQLYDLLTDHKKHQIVFHGPPGTGKTFVAREFAAALAGSDGTVHLVQFHPSYAYEDFVEGFRPRLKGNEPGFELTPGPLRTAAEAAIAKPDATHVLIIDELNRANVAKVLGELYFLLEYRDEAIRLQYSNDEFRLPPNLWLIATMNTADRSIALVDAALRRRFHFVGFFPDKVPIEGLLRRWLTEHRPEMVWVADLVDLANSKLPDRHLAIGPSFFLRSDLDEGRLQMVWEYSVLPYLEEQFLGNEAALNAFAYPALVRELRQEPNSSDSEERDPAP